MKELSEAIFLPAMSKAVPWSGEVLTTDKPEVKFTPFPKDKVLKGTRPWSWYIASTPSKAFNLLEPKKPSAGYGPKANIPLSSAF